MLVLRQKLQASRISRGSQSGLGSQGAPDSIPYAGGATAMLESGKKDLFIINRCSLNFNT